MLYIKYHFSRFYNKILVLQYKIRYNKYELYLLLGGDVMFLGKQPKEELLKLLILSMRTVMYIH